jgi:23S rRNA pseudouridine1911/1915/1917 synthase
MSALKLEPSLVYECASFIVVDKPAGMHSASLIADEEGTLSSWCLQRFPQARSVRGKKACEYGLLHRLDRETRGLVLFALTETALREISRQQEAGQFIKDYRCRCAPTGQQLEGFPPLPDTLHFYDIQGLAGVDTIKEPLRIQSRFRPFGPGRAAVRPVAIDPINSTKSWADKKAGEQVYETELFELNTQADGDYIARCRIRCGYRHQVRAHLAWLGLPLNGDTLYGGEPGKAMDFLASALNFIHPESGQAIQIEASYI